MRSGFFNSEITGYDSQNMPVYDRAEEASFFAKYFSQFIGNGVYANPSTSMQVVADSDMTIQVSIGTCFINGYFGWVETAESLEIEEAESLSRIDRIVARLSLEDDDRKIYLDVLQGEESTSPTAPELTRSDSVYEIALADISISNTTIEITDDLITDLRWDTDLCGEVTGVIDQIDTTTLFNQFVAWYESVTSQAESDLADQLDELEEQFNSWFSSLKTTLSDDVAGNLQLEIEEITPRTNAGAHNSVYRGEDITDLFYDGTLTTEIAAGTFDDIFIGDYIIGQSSGLKYLVADINYRLYKGKTQCKTPHVLMIPELIMGTAAMQSDSSSDVTYINSEMYTTNLESYREIIEEDFNYDDTSHILATTDYFANAITDDYESAGTSYDSYIELMNELMVYGTNIHHNKLRGSNEAFESSSDVSQLSLFRLDKSKIGAFSSSGERTAWWLRDFSKEHYFCSISVEASPNCSSQPSSLGIRPAFLIY